MANLGSSRESGHRQIRALRTFMGLPRGEVTDDTDFAIIGVPSDAGSSFRAGARFAPDAIRDRSRLLGCYNPALDVDVFEHCTGVDCGDVPVVPGDVEGSLDAIVQFVTPFLERRTVPVFLGGDHAITLAELRVVAAQYGPVGLVDFDAHSDTMDEDNGRKFTHGTTFKRAVEEGLLDVCHSIQVGIRGSVESRDDARGAFDLGLDLATADEARQRGMLATVARIRERVAGAPVFLSFDIDFLDPAYAPGTGEPEPGGFTSGEALDCIRGLAGLRFVAFDVVEVLPAMDPSEITSILAANVVYEFLCLVALDKAGPS